MRIILSSNVNVTLKQVVNSPVFTHWAARLGPHWQGVVTVTDAGFWDGEVRTLQIAVAATGDPWPSKLTLRSETVDVLVVITDGSQSHIVFVEQYRPAAGARVMSNVAGGVGWSEPVLAAAAREVQEELDLNQSIHINYTLLVPRPVLATPGLTNERTHLVQAVLQLPPAQIGAFLEQLQGKHTGVEAEGESIVTHVTPAGRARRFILAQPDPDAKTLLSLSLAGF